MIRTFFIALAATFLSCHCIAGSTWGFDSLQVGLRAVEISVSESELSIGDVCEITGGSKKLREKIASLDLDSFDQKNSISISRQQVAMRIALAGIDRNSLKFTGPDKSVVKLFSTEQLQPRLESKIASEISSQFGISPGDVRVRLLDTKLLNRLQKTIDTNDFNVSAYFSSKLPLGEQYIQADFTDARGNRDIQKFKVQIVVLQNVYVTSAIVSKGTVITADHVQNIKRPLIDNRIELAGAECVGCVASRNIAPHEIVTTRDLDRRPVRKQIIIKRNDLVDVVLTHGRLKVRLKNAKAMTNGAKGDLIRVLNTNSNKELNAIVQDQRTVVAAN